MVCGLGSGRGQLKSVSGAGCVRLCGHVKLLVLNSADHPVYLYRSQGRGHGLCYKLCFLRALVSSVIPFKSLDKFIKNIRSPEFHRTQYHHTAKVKCLLTADNPVPRQNHIIPSNKYSRIGSSNKHLRTFAHFPLQHVLELLEQSCLVWYQVPQKRHPGLSWYKYICIADVGQNYVPSPGDQGQLPPETVGCTV